jgi:hypothetical protein
VSYALSARNASASKPSIRRGTGLQYRLSQCRLPVSRTRQLPSVICCLAPFCTADILSAAARPEVSACALIYVESIIRIFPEARLLRRPPASSIFLCPASGKTTYACCSSSRILAACLSAKRPCVSATLPR